MSWRSSEGYVAASARPPNLKYSFNPLLHAIRNNGIIFFSFWNSKENVSNKLIPKKNFLICCK